MTDTFVRAESTSSTRCGYAGPAGAEQVRPPAIGTAPGADNAARRSAEDDAPGEDSEASPLAEAEGAGEHSEGPLAEAEAPSVDSQPLPADEGAAHGLDDDALPSVEAAAPGMDNDALPSVEAAAPGIDNDALPPVEAAAPGIDNDALPPVEEAAPRDSEALSPSEAPHSGLEVQGFPPESIEIGRRSRSLDPEQVEELAKSIKPIGLKTPITIWLREQAEPVLVAGRHRLESVKRLKHESVPCFIQAGSELNARLWEIDENLCRADLTELEQGEHLLERKKIYEDLYPTTKQGGLPGAPGGGKTKTTNLAGFATDTAGKTGISETSLRRKVRRIKMIDPRVRERIRSKKGIADNGEELDALASLSPYQQKLALDMVGEGKAANVGAAKALLEGSADPEDAVAKQKGKAFEWENGARQLIECLVHAVLRLDEMPILEGDIYRLLKYCHMGDLATRWSNRWGNEPEVSTWDGEMVAVDSGAPS